MMLFKLSARNLRKSMRDYMIYFATLILGVAIFYVFNAMESQTVLMDVSKNTAEIIRLMNSMLSVVSVFVSFILGFLIVYASNFLMKRRKKEFGTYMLLGMSKKNISMIILIETVLIGMISLVAGLILGICASQGMSIVVANMFEADMTGFKFVVSTSAIIKTILYFIVMYLVVLVMDTIVVGRARLINLLQAGKRSEKNVAKNPWICLIVFVIACVILGSAYYYVTAGAQSLTETSEVVTQVVKGIVTTFMIFWSLSGLILWIAKKFKKFYYSGLNSFTVKEFGSRINTTVFAGSVICLMLFITICVLSSAMSMKKSLNDGLKEMVSADVNFDMLVYGEKEYQGEWIRDIFDETKIDTSMFKDVVDIYTYTGKNGELNMKNTLGDYVKDSGASGEEIHWWEQTLEEVIKLSDYNKVAKLYGLKEYSLSDDEYMIVANYESMIQTRNEGLKRNTVITIGGKKYKPKFQECKDGYIYMSSNATNFGIIIVPDSANLSTLQTYKNYYLANYNPSDDKTMKEIETYIDSEKFEKTINPENLRHPTISMDTRTHIYEASIGLTAMVVFIGLYLGIIFMISSAAILALKELSEAADNQEKYRILRRIGVDEKSINRSLLAQSAMFFGLPLLIAIIHSIFGIQTCLFILETFGKTGLLYSILTTGAMILVIYGGYFLITYYCSKKIIK